MPDAVHRVRHSLSALLPLRRFRPGLPRYALAFGLLRASLALSDRPPFAVPSAREPQFPAYTPYVLTVAGSSGSDQRPLHVLFATLAAFPPATKDRLTEHGLIAPALQMLLRRHYDGGGGEAWYLSDAAHPVIFRGDKMDLSAMVAAAQAMTADALPPLACLTVVEESFETAERRFTTPCAVARTMPQPDAERRIRLDARSSRDADRRPLSWRWVRLRGEEEAVTIRPLDPDAACVEVAVRSPRQRIDVALFAWNGVHWSAPAVVSIAPATAETPPAAP